jgi:hypothetical protein
MKRVIEIQESSFNIHQMKQEIVQYGDTLTEACEVFCRTEAREQNEICLIWSARPTCTSGTIIAVTVTGHLIHEL